MFTQISRAVEQRINPYFYFYFFFSNLNSFRRLWFEEKLQPRQMNDKSDQINADCQHSVQELLISWILVVTGCLRRCFKSDATVPSAQI